MRILLLFGVVLGMSRLVHAQAVDSRIQGIVDSVSAERLAATVRGLEGFGTRFLMSDTVSTTR